VGWEALAWTCVPSMAITSTWTMPASAHSARTSPSSSSNAALVALAKARDRSVIRSVIGRDDADRNVPHDSAARSVETTAHRSLGVEQQGDHHHRIVRRALPANHGDRQRETP